jgi:hypothetical protein
MARPIKLTVDYFSHDAGASGGKTITILENHYGHEGYAVWFKLLESLSTTKNHVLDIRNQEEKEYLAGKMKVKPERLLEILDKVAYLKAIDEELWKHHIIWCQNFVDRLHDVYENRNRPLPTKPSLPEPILLNNKVVIRGRNSVSTQETIVSSPETPQRKVKEKKLKETKVYGEFQNVFLADDEYHRLVARFTEAGCKERIETLSTGIQSKGYKYKDFYATILSWERNENKHNGAGHSTLVKSNSEPDRNISRGGRKYTPDEEEGSGTSKVVPG